MLEAAHLTHTGDPAGFVPVDVSKASEVFLCPITLAVSVRSLRYP